MFGPAPRIGTLLGIPVHLHWTWWVIFALSASGLANFFREEAPNAVAAYVLGVATSLVFFATLLAHEFGHALAARYFGIGTERITLMMMGGVAQIEQEPRTAGEEIGVAVAGPAVSLALAAVFGVGYLGAMAGGLAALTTACGVLAVLNLLMAAFNMMPGFPMDGGRVLRGVLWYATGDPVQSTWVASLFGRGFGWLLMGLGVVVLFQGVFSGVLYIVMGFFLSKLAADSYRMVSTRHALDGLPLNQLFRPVQAVVPAELPLRRVVTDFMQQLPNDRFPVVRGSSLLGYICADDIRRVDQSLWDATPAERLVRPWRRSEVLDSSESTSAAMQRLSEIGRPDIPVFSNGYLVGFLHARDVMTAVGSRLRR